MRDHHVLVGAGRFVEVGALIQAERFRYVDLDVIDEVAVPDRLEQAIRETQGEHVLGGLLAEEVVDPEYVGLVEDLVHLPVELDRGLQIGAERLLHDHPGPVDQAGPVEHADDVQRGGRRDAQVVQAPDVLTELFLGRGDGRGQGLRARRGRHIAQVGGEGLPLVPDRHMLAEVVDSGLRERTEVVVRHFVQR